MRKQKIVIVIEPQYFPYHTPSMIGNIFAAQFAIDEKESNEILKIVRLRETFFNSKEKLNTGMDLPFYIERRGKSEHGITILFIKIKMINSLEILMILLMME